MEWRTGVVLLAICGCSGPDGGEAQPQGGTGDGPHHHAGSGRARPLLFDAPLVDRSWLRLTGDVDGDGLTDMIATTFEEESGWSAFAMVARGDGTFEAGPTFASQVQGVVAFGDFDRDGRAD